METVERFAEGNSTDADLIAAGQVAYAVLSERTAEVNAAGRDASTDPVVLAADAVYTLASTDEEMIRDASPFWPGDPLCEYIAAVLSLTIKATENHKAETPEQADLVRDIFAEDFHPVTFLPEWRTPTVVAMAQGMYASGNFSAMPILADALEEAGCGDAAMLTHCRGPGPHVRGCWVVDRILGKE